MVILHEMKKMKQPLVLFDGICNLCTASVRFIIERDPRAKFTFAALQSQVGQTVMKKYEQDIPALSTILLIKDQKVYSRSAAVLHIARELKGAWPLLYGFIILPKFIRDAVYALIAKNRYKWFGKRKSCMVPTSDRRARFLV